MKERAKEEEKKKIEQEKTRKEKKGTVQRTTARSIHPKYSSHPAWKSPPLAKFNNKRSRSLSLSLFVRLV